MVVELVDKSTIVFIAPPHITAPILVLDLLPVDHRFGCTGSICDTRHYFTTREARVIPPHTSGIIGHS